MVFIDRLRSVLAGVAVGLFFAVLYLRITTDAKQGLDALHVGAVGITLASVALTLWLALANKKKAV